MSQSFGFGKTIFLIFENYLQNGAILFAVWKSCKYFAIETRTQQT